MTKVALSKQLLDIVACPKCKGELIYVEDQEELHCMHCRLIYPIRDDIPILLIQSAKELKTSQDG